MKITEEELAEGSGFSLDPIPWTKTGYFYKEEDQPARHPYYSAGLYYLQEPSAMTPAARFPVEPGEDVYKRQARSSAVSPLCRLRSR